MMERRTKMRLTEENYVELAEKAMRDICDERDKKDRKVPPETKSQGLFHQIHKEVTFCGLPHGADA